MKTQKNEQSKEQDFDRDFDTFLCPACGANLIVEAVNLFDIQIKEFEICKCGFDANIKETPF